MLHLFFCRLSFEKLKTHPEYAKATAAEKAANRKALKSVAFPRAEKLKNALRKIYEDEYEKYNAHLVSINFFIFFIFAF